jgi:hypothetical protein
MHQFPNRISAKTWFEDWVSPFLLRLTVDGLEVSDMTTSDAWDAIGNDLHVGLDPFRDGGPATDVEYTVCDVVNHCV